MRRETALHLRNSISLQIVYDGNLCLFDLDADPCEYRDLRESQSTVFEMMYELLLQYNSTQRVPTLYSLFEEDYEGADPAKFDGFWSPWLEEEPTLQLNVVNIDIQI